MTSKSTALARLFARAMAVATGIATKHGFEHAAARASLMHFHIAAVSSPPDAFQTHRRVRLSQCEAFRKDCSRLAASIKYVLAIPTTAATDLLLLRLCLVRAPAAEM
jgi:hypothetical protein